VILPPPALSRKGEATEMYQLERMQDEFQEHHTGKISGLRTWEGGKRPRDAAAHWITTKKLQIQQLHRFPNGMIKSAGVSHWDVIVLYREMLTGITAAVGAKNRFLKSMHRLRYLGSGFGLLTATDF